MLFSLKEVAKEQFSVAVRSKVQVLNNFVLTPPDGIIERLN